MAALVSSIPTTAVRSLFRGGRNKIRRHRIEARAAPAVGARSRVRLGPEARGANLRAGGDVVDAVRFAVEVQTAMIERNAGVPEDTRI